MAMVRSRPPCPEVVRLVSANRQRVRGFLDRNRPMKESKLQSTSLFAPGRGHPPQSFTVCLCYGSITPLSVIWYSRTARPPYLSGSFMVALTLSRDGGGPGLVLTSCHAGSCATPRLTEGGAGRT